MSKNISPNWTDHRPIQANSPAILSSFQKGRYALEELSQLVENKHSTNIPCAWCLIIFSVFPHFFKNSRTLCGLSDLFSALAIDNLVMPP
jgi:hypothetical protein